ncbi:DUF2975 domain-containing protein [Adhaeribacter rhizoryzae]|uniref:DUF2975 domain-containing protein n=1 Tax=Adhaeribacter rhizoryzae TaxID=2607907 RepID=A0A5M6DJH8_9BACT|nr:DUF2975 domain-containing protein [Adhaeribacter rhizoryzae]KAA5546412.1 DUF2975 domain-containing protein [Adhaeribacter rhizoryzae]
MKTLGKYSLSALIKLIIYVSWYIQLLFLVLLTVLLSISFIAKEDIQSDLTVRLTQSQPLAVKPAPAATNINNVTLKLNAGELHFTQDKSLPLVIYNLGVMWIGFAISLGITNLLRKIFDSLTDNNPFVVENAQRLRQIALLIILIAPITFMRDLFLNWYLRQNFVIDGSAIQTHLTLDFKTIFIGLILLIIAEIFRIGTRLKEDQELTV